MTVAELIEELQKVTNKKLEVKVSPMFHDDRDLPPQKSFNTSNPLEEVEEFADKDDAPGQVCLWRYVG